MAMFCMVMDSLCKIDSIVCNSIMDEEDGGLSLSSYYKFEKLRPTEFETRILQELDVATSYSFYEKPIVPIEKSERLRRLNAQYELQTDYKKVREGNWIVYSRSLRNQFHKRILEKMDLERPRIQGKYLKKKF